MLFFTPTKPDRVEDSFLDPVKRRHVEILRTMKIHADVIRLVDGRPGLARAYDDALDAANQNLCDWILAIEDDEAPPVDTFLRFIEAADKIRREDSPAMVLTGTKRLRDASLKGGQVKCYPWRWHMGIYGIDHVEGIPPGLTDPYIRINGGTIATPMLINPAFLAAMKIGFHEDNPPNWDYHFGKDLYDKGIPFYCVPSVHAKHYCVEDRKIYE